MMENVNDFILTDRNNVTLSFNEGLNGKSGLWLVSNDSYITDFRWFEKSGYYTRVDGELHEETNYNLDNYFIDTSSERILDIKKGSLVRFRLTARNSPDLFLYFYNKGELFYIFDQ